MPEQKKTIVALLSDLMFTAKIQNAAKRVGVDVVFVKSAEEAMAHASENPAAIILDLNNTALDPLQAITELRALKETAGIGLLGYVSHVQTDLKQAALEAGCDEVMARSAFSHNLPSILKRYAEG